MKFKIFRFKKVNSTNNTAIRIIKNSNLDYGMIISEMQNNGRGQFGNKWISYKGNLFVSFLRNNNSYHSVPEMRKFKNTRKFIFFGIDSRYDIWDKKDTRSEDRFKKFLSE